MTVDGQVAPGFEPVRDVFADVLAAQGGAGAGLACWHEGRWVVDLYGGWADAARTRPWAPDTLVMPYSVSKPFAAVSVLLLADRGVVDLDAPVQRYWPEMTAATTLRQILSHSAGLVVLDATLPASAFSDWDLLCSSLARQEPAWEPGTAAGESALFYGHLLGEVVRRVDGRTPGRFLRDEVCGPWGLDFHVGLGEEELRRTADLVGFGADLTAAADRPPLYDAALGNPAGALDPAVVNSAEWRRAEIPAVNGHGTAKSVAGLYRALEVGVDGRRLLSDRLHDELVRCHTTGPEQVVGGTASWGLGVSVEAGEGYGMGGVGGSFGWWSTDGQYAFAFLTAHIGDYDRGDRLENAVREVLGLPPV